MHTTVKPSTSSFKRKKRFTQASCITNFPRKVWEESVVRILIKFYIQKIIREVLRSFDHGEWNLTRKNFKKKSETFPVN